MFGKVFAKNKVIEAFFKNLNKTLENKKEGLIIFYIFYTLRTKLPVIVTTKHFFASFVTFYNYDK